jgi:ferredoxin
MRIAVDRELCIGSGACEALLPDVFEVGDDGVVTVLRPEVAPDGEDDVRDAVAQCPTGALSLAE